MKFPALKISVKPQVEGFFDSTSYTISYIVKHPASQACGIVDSVIINIVQEPAKV